MKKQKKPQKRDLAVPAMVLRNGKGAHVEHKKRINKTICREKIDQEEREN